MSLPPYAIRRSDRARQARIHVTADGVEVVVPRRLPIGEIEPFVREKRPWIERTLRKMQEAQSERPRPTLEDGSVIPYLGEELVLTVVVEPHRTRPLVRRRGVQLVAKVAADDRESIQDALERWFRARAKEEIEWRLDEATARAGSSYAGLSIRAQRTRWASCSSKGAMSFNWRLLLAPPEIVDYVVEHEVAHLDVHDHSRRFWRLLERRLPDYREHESWLRKHGQSLTL